MALFFCGIILAHYNNYNLSEASQITSHYIFASLANVSEFFVFLYVGMGFFTGRFVEWNVFFSIMAILFCLIARACNIFPFAIIANIGRTRKIPWRMMIVMWFAGLRGAIAFALSWNMPGKHSEVYATTTLSIVVFTTVICGGLTEPILSRMKMKLSPGAADNSHGQDYNHADNDNIRRASANSPTPEGSADGGAFDGFGGLWPLELSYHSLKHMPTKLTQQVHSGMHYYFKQFDNQYMKPLFGGSIPEMEFDDGGGSQQIELLSNKKSDADITIPVSPHDEAQFRHPHRVDVTLRSTHMDQEQYEVRRHKKNTP